MLTWTQFVLLAASGGLVLAALGYAMYALLSSAC